MAFSTGIGNGGAPTRGRWARGGGSIAEINVVPLVDVVLVLLIIFMLTAHVMEFGLEVNVPKVNQVKDSTEDLPVVTITKDGVIALGDKPANINSLGDDVKARYPGRKAVYVRADGETTWEPVAQVMDVLGQSGLEVRAVTQPADSAYTRK
jgi:biopolymer transport protein ExbD